MYVIGMWVPRFSDSPRPSQWIVITVVAVLGGLAHVDRGGDRGRREAGTAQWTKPSFSSGERLQVLYTILSPTLTFSIARINNFICR